MDDAAKAAIGIIGSVIGLAIVAVIFSKNANTGGVIGSASSGLANIVGAATAPITGAAVAVNTGGSGSSGGGFLGGLGGMSGGGGPFGSSINSLLNPFGGFSNSFNI